MNFAVAAGRKVYDGNASLWKDVISEMLAAYSNDCKSIGFIDHVI
jgi:hypothetical protein